MWWNNTSFRSMSGKGVKLALKTPWSHKHSIVFIDYDELWEPRPCMIFYCLKTFLGKNMGKHFLTVSNNYSFSPWSYIYSTVQSLCCQFTFFKAKSFFVSGAYFWIIPGKLGCNYHMSIRKQETIVIHFLQFEHPWCIYPPSYVSGQASLVSMVFSCFCCCHSS